MSKIYNTVEDILDDFKNKEMLCKLEKRPEKYMFGSKNYGEIVGTVNPADGDAWDIIVPGYEALDVEELYTIKKIEGVIVMPNGNHKLIANININKKRNSTKSCRDEIFQYRRLYNKICKRRGHVILY